MLPIWGENVRLCDGLNRREWLRLGGLSALGLSLADLLAAQARASTSAPAAGSTFGRAKNCIYLWLQGGPPQHETFDPKPAAPVEIRGPFKAITTNVPGIQFSELLPRTAGIVDKLAIIRSLSTNDNNHDSSGYWLLTGHRYTGPNSREIRPTDWPYFGSLVRMLKPSERLPQLSSVWLPDVMRLNDNVQPAGQTGGFLGRQLDPERFVCDPSAADFHVEGLTLPREIPPLRLSQRAGLLTQIEQHFAAIEQGDALAGFGQLQNEALSMLTSGVARQAFELDAEPAALRDRYGRHKWGQSVMLARRLVEAGCRLVHVNWPREPGDVAADNPLWDTHSQNADRLVDVLCPQFDVTFAALIEDLADRGLLDETLVVAIGEFGRTPQINKFGGRDHWGAVFCCALAGAGIRGAQVYGASDKAGAYPTVDPVSGGDLTATLFHLLGINPQGTFLDRQGRRLNLTDGQPLWRLLGDGPATTERCLSTGDVNSVPPFDARHLSDQCFEQAAPFAEFPAPLRYRGWLFATSPTAAGEAGLWARRVEVQDPAEATPAVRREAQLGLGSVDTPSAAHVPTGTRLVLAQMIRAPMAGRYSVSVDVAAGRALSPTAEALWREHFICRLALVGYRGLDKNPLEVREFATVELTPNFADATPHYQRYELAQRLRAQDDGALELSLGIAVAIIIERRTAGELIWPADVERPGAVLRVRGVTVEFNARARDDRVVV